MSKKSKKCKQPGVINVNDPNSCYICFRPFQVGDQVSVLTVGLKSYKLCNRCAKEFR